MAEDATLPDPDPGEAPDVVEAPRFEVATGGWSLQPGEERTMCAILELDNADPILVSAIETTVGDR